MNKPVTDLIHHSYTPPAGFAAPQPPAYEGSTVFFISAIRNTAMGSLVGMADGQSAPRSWPP